MKIEVSNGEIIDRLTILEIKLERIKDPDKLINISKEYEAILPFAEQIIDLNNQLVKDLKTINISLWEIEDRIRDLERNADFGALFVQTARQVYINNDDRARIKKEINLLTNSGFTEEKSYKKY